MGTSLIPSILRPDYTWPRPTPFTIVRTTPAVPPVPRKAIRIACGIVHRALCRFSQWYCSWFGITFDAHIVQLPFGLVMKWTDRTSVEEVVSMQMAAAAGIPVPRVLGCGEHPKEPSNRKISILMTRLPGVSLENSNHPLNIDDEEPWLEELKMCVCSMRPWHPPSQEVVSSPIGTSLRSSRVPDNIMGPFMDQRGFYQHLIYPTSAHGFKPTTEYEETLALADKLQQGQYQIMFTHGDFKAHNILVGDDGHLSGFLDWESAGWYPEYGEFTTAMRFGKGSWWFQVASWIGGDQYSEELGSEVALNLLNVDSYTAF